MKLRRFTSHPDAPTAKLLGPQIQPLSILAARSEAERAEHFPFTEEDQELFSLVLRSVRDEHH